MVFEHEGDHASQWAAIGSIAAKPARKRLARSLLSGR
jgi:hypothetical protein